MNLFYHDHLTSILPYNQVKKQIKYNETKKQKQINKKHRDAFCFEYADTGFTQGLQSHRLVVTFGSEGPATSFPENKNVMLQQQQQQILLNITIKTLQYNRYNKLT